METITKIISDDYKKGLIMFDCQSLDDIRKVGDIIAGVAFNMRFSNINDKDNKMDVNKIYDELMLKIKDFEVYLNSVNVLDLPEQAIKDFEKLRRYIAYRSLQEMAELIFSAKRLYNLKIND